MITDICRVYENYEIKNISSMKTGGVSKIVYEPQNKEELQKLIRWLYKNKEKYIVLGNLTNVLVSDDGFEVPVILTRGMNDIEQTNDNLFYAGAGVSYTSFAYKMCCEGFSGLEFAYGIPGTVAGAVFMNAGAYGGETSGVIKTVYALDKTGNEVVLSNEQCDFSYRHSVFQNNDYVIYGADFEFVKKNPDECIKQAKEYMKQRIEKQPLEKPSCGSTFKRPEGYFAGKLIQDAGLSGFKVGGACVSTKHCGFVVNDADATTSDVVELMRIVRDKVKSIFGVTLQPEIMLLDKNGDVYNL